MSLSGEKGFEGEIDENGTNRKYKQKEKIRSVLNQHQ